MTELEGVTLEPWDDTELVEPVDLLVTLDEVLAPVVEAGVVLLVVPDTLELSMLEEVADVLELVGQVVSEADVLEEEAFVLVAEVVGQVVSEVERDVLDETLMFVAELVGQLVSETVLEETLVVVADVVDELLVLVAELVGQVVSEADVLEEEAFVLVPGVLDETLVLVAELVGQVVSEADVLEEAFVLVIGVLDEALVLVALDETPLLEAELETTVDVMDDLEEVWLPDVTLD